MVVDRRLARRVRRAPAVRPQRQHLRPLPRDVVQGEVPALALFPEASL